MAPGPAADRALALLVRETLVVEATSPSEAAVGPAGAPWVSSESDSTTAAGPPPWAFILDAGATLAAGSASAEPQAGLALALGTRWRLDRWLGELYLGAHVMSPLSVESPEGQLHAREFPILAGVRLLYCSKYVALGPLVEPAIRLLEIDAQTARGTTGTSFRAVPTVLLAPELRLVASQWVELRFAPGLELPLLRQRFSMNGTPVLDLGPARGVSQASVVGSLP